jgi:hypothetical protein
MAGTYEIPQTGNPNSTEDPKIKTILSGYNESLDASNKLEAKSLSAGALGRWYAPVEIATKQERENVAFGKLATPDEVASVVLPANGLIVVGYRAKWESSVASAGRAAIFLSAVQLKSSTEAVAQEAQTSETVVKTLTTLPIGLTSAAGTAAFPTTGAPIANDATGGLTYIYAAAGTYSVSIQFKATSGKVAVKERVLQVGVIGV